MRNIFLKSACICLCLMLFLVLCGCEMTYLSDETVGTSAKPTTQTTTTTMTTTTTIKTTVKTTVTTTKQTAPATTTVKKTTVQQVKGDGITVYTTPSGKRYHLDPQCGGKNSMATDKETAVRAGRTPCQKCAQ